MRLKGRAILLVFVLVVVSLSGCITIPGQLPALSFLPVVQAFIASPAVINAGEYSILSWAVTGASNVYIDNNVGNVALQGSIPVFPAATSYYTLTAYNSSGSATARTQIVVTGSAQPQLKPPVILSFFSDKSSVNAGDAVTLHWNTAEATLIVLEPGGTVSAQGSKTVYPYVTSDYSLTASSSCGVAKGTLTVVVAGPAAGPVVVPSGTEKVVVLPAISAESGSLVKNNAVYTIKETACIGDTSLSQASRAFLSFNITGIPLNATVHEAFLDMSSYTQIGNPTYGTAMYGNMGAIEIDAFQYGKLADLDTMSYNRTATQVSGGNITDYPLSPWRVDVKNSSAGAPVVQNLVQSGQERCQFRIQFFTSTNWDGVSDMLCFDDAKLIIRYTVP